ncbi:MAG: hypothetical protein WBY44_33515 [Bryobacteraceae bacterium]
MKFFDETHGPVYELTRHFLSRIFDSELFSAAGRWRSAAIGAFSMLLLTGVAAFYQGPLTVARFHRLAYASPETLRDTVLAGEAGRMMLFLAVSGLIAVLQWQALLPSRHDYLALASLPVRPRQVFAARFLAFMLFSLVAVAALNALPSLFAPPLTPARSYWANVAAQAAASSLACFFALFFMMALQGALLNFLPGRVYARASAYVQGISATVFFLAALESWHVADWAGSAGILYQYSWAPPMWFAALHRALLGDRDPLIGALALRAVLVFAAAVALAVSAYFLSYWRYRSLLLEPAGAGASPAARRWNLVSLLVRDPRRAAILDFMDKTLSRSRTHRLVLLGYAGLAFGLLINSVLLALAAAHWQIDWDTLLRFMTFYWPLTASMILIPGIRHALSLPTELGANWIFRITESNGRAQWMGAVEAFVLIYAIAPVFVLLAPAAIMALGWATGLRMMTLQALASLAIFEMLFYSWQQLPFACSYAPGKKPLASVVGRYLAAIFFLAPALSIIIATVGQMTVLFAFFAAAFGALWLWVRRERRQGWGEAKLIYEDDPDALADLGLRG